MKIVFMGTPDFAAAALEALILAGHEITAVVTQPDKPKGRSGALQMPPVKECAIRYGISCMQPERIKHPQAVEELKKYEAEVYIVAAFGQILSQEILDIPRFGCLNIHASLLPKYRGASPIQRVILDGEEKTGITVMQMDAGLDTGDMLYKKELLIDKTDTFETLHDKLAKLGAEAITEALPLLEAGKLIPKKQREEESSYASLIKKEMGYIDFSKSAKQLDCRIRAFYPWPGAYTSLNGKQLKIFKATVCEKTEAGKKPGSVAEVTKDKLRVACGEGSLWIGELQLEGKKRMSVHDFLLGGRLKPGDVLGEIDG